MQVRLETDRKERCDYRDDPLLPCPIAKFFHHSVSKILSDMFTAA